MRRHAWAKVNLALSVGPPEGGMHRIASWMHAIDLADTIEIERADEFSVAIEWAADAPRPTPIDWPVERDLAVRAHHALEAHVGRRLPVRLSVKKRIPVGAGLGGGSSDAAATLLVLNEVFELGVTCVELQALSAPLGSDIAYFIDDYDPPRAAIVSGFADRIERLASRSDALLLIIPACACPTGEVYRAYDALGAGELDESRVREAAAASGLSGLFNDLAAAAERVRPAMAGIREAASRVLGAPVIVTGSGSAMFSPVQRAGEIADIDAVVLPVRLVGPDR